MDGNELLYLFKIYYEKTEEELEDLYYNSLIGIALPLLDFWSLSKEQKANILVEIETKIPVTRLLQQYENWKFLSAKEGGDLTVEDLLQMQKKYSKKYKAESEKFRENKEKAIQLEQHAIVALKYANLKKYEPFLNRIIRTGKEESLLKIPLKAVLEELACELERLTECKLNEENRSVNNLYNIYLFTLQSLQKETPINLEDQTKYLIQLHIVEEAIQRFPKNKQKLQIILQAINESILLLQSSFTPSFCEELAVGIERVKSESKKTLSL